MGIFDPTPPTQTFMEFYGLCKRPRHLREMVSALALEPVVQPAVGTVETGPLISDHNGSKGRMHEIDGDGEDRVLTGAQVEAASTELEASTEATKSTEATESTEQAPGGKRAGLEDTRELARVIKCMLEDGCIFELTSTSAGRSPSSMPSGASATPTPKSRAVEPPPAAVHEAP